MQRQGPEVLKGILKTNYQQCGMKEFSAGKYQQNVPSAIHVFVLSHIIYLE